MKSGIVVNPDDENSFNLFSVSSLEKYEVPETRETCFVINSPIETERNHKAMMEVLNGEIIIDGIECKPTRFGWNCLNGPIFEGETISIFVAL